MITDEEGPYKVVLYYSTPYNNAPGSSANFINNAVVTIEDEEGISTPLRYNRSGIYETPSGMRGMIGKSYSLKIVLDDGSEYRSTAERMIPIPSIDTIYGEYQRFSRGFLRGEFSLFLDLTDVSEDESYFSWNWTHYTFEKYCGLSLNSIDGSLSATNCCEPCWSYERCNGCINIFSDELVKGSKIPRIPITKIPYDSQDPYFLIVTQRSLTKNAYYFWKDASDLVSNAGGVFDKPPVAIKGNLVNSNDPEEQVLGFFEVSSVQHKSVYFERDNVDEIPFGTPPTYRVVGSSCIPCDEGAYRTTVMPQGW